MSVLLTTRGRAPRRSVRPAEVRRRAERMLAALGIPDAELSVLLCDDSVLRRLNRQYRGEDRPTDVLAFAMREGEGGALGERVLGDVVISVETARRQARRGRRTISDEVTTLLAHGLLHLLGFDHRTEAEDRRMRARTDALRAAAVAR